MAIFTSEILYDVIAVLTTLLLGLVLYSKWKFLYWVKVGLPILQPTFPFGDATDMILGRRTFGEVFRDCHNKFKSNGFKHGGIYMFLSPVYLPTDPDIIKHILQKDFSYFVNHGVTVDETVDPLNAHLFNLEDDQWRNMRIKLTPTFTSGKMKMMFQTLADCSVGLKDIMDEAAASHSPVDIKNVLGRFTTDIIGSVAFGLECNSLKDPEAEFRKYGKKIFEVSPWDRIRTLFLTVLPKSVVRAIKLRRTKPDVEKFFMKAIRDTVEYRERNNVFRKDFLHLLIQLKNRGAVMEDDKISDDGKTTEKALTMSELAAQCYVFFVAGFETSSTAMTFALLELATNQQVQEKLRNEINSVLAKHDNQLTYAAVMEMTYLEKVLYETLRKHPPIPGIIRKCNKDYTIPGTSIKLEAGTTVNISTLALHNDPEYYPDPEKFDPDRFSEECKKTRPDFTWLPFGEGPRLCIGLRFGMLQSRVGLCTLLRNYKITLNGRTKVPIQTDKKSFVNAVEGGVWLNIEKLD